MQTKKVSISSYVQIRAGLLCLYRDKLYPSILVLVKDRSTDQIFDALTDQEYDLSVEEAVGKETSTEYYYHAMHHDLMAEEDVKGKIFDMGVLPMVGLGS